MPTIKVSLETQKHAFTKREILEELGWKMIEESTLPAGPGVLVEEIGEPGPWYGVTDNRSITVGWTREPRNPDIWAIAFEEIGWESACRQLLREIRKLRTFADEGGPSGYRVGG